MSNQVLIECEKALNKLASFIIKHHDVINVCMVDFISKDIFRNVLDTKIQNELLRASDQDIIDLPSKLLQHEQNHSGEDPYTKRTISSASTPTSSPALDTLIQEISSLTLTSLNVTTPKEQIVESKNASILTHFDHFMSQKKMHEVLKMSDTMSALCERENVSRLVDVGSGKAYLSQILAALRQNLLILAIDSQSVNLKGAQKRSANLEKQWEALIRRAKSREAGETPPRRGKRGKNWKPKDFMEGEAQISEINDASHATSQNEKSSDNTDSYQEEDPNKLVLNNLNYETLFVDTTTDLKSIFESNFQEIPGNEKQSLGLMGLHTCGNLAPDSLKIFLANPSIKFCCNVGCCYHHLDEEFFENPYKHKNETENTDEKRPSFPLSDVLRERNFSLGRNARMIAAQPMDRLITNKQLPNHSLLWRAILQHILLKHIPDLGIDDQQVGRIASKCTDFHDYVVKCFKKLGIELQMTQEEIQNIYAHQSEEFGHKLNSFYQLRSIFTPLIEGLILLDRLTYMHQQPQIAEAHLTQLFDAYISPRCYAIIAIKK